VQSAQPEANRRSAVQKETSVTTCKCGQPCIEGKMTCGRAACGSSTGNTMPLAEMEAVARQARADLDRAAAEAFEGLPGAGMAPAESKREPVLVDGMPCPYCSPGCETRGLLEPTIKDDHVVCFCPCHRLAEVLLLQSEAEQDEWPRPPFERFAKSLVEEARWSSQLHKNDSTGQAASDQRSLVALAEQVMALGKRLGFV
jgi:hypothetical protein